MELHPDADLKAPHWADSGVGAGGDLALSVAARCPGPDATTLECFRANGNLRLGICPLSPTLKQLPEATPESEADRRQLSRACLRRLISGALVSGWPVRLPPTYEGPFYPPRFRTRPSWRPRPRPTRSDSDPRTPARGVRRHAGSVGVHHRVGLANLRYQRARGTGEQHVYLLLVEWRRLWPVRYHSPCRRPGRQRSTHGASNPNPVRHV